MTSPVAKAGYEGPVVDAHLHVDPDGLGAEGLKAFKRAGGTHAFAVVKPGARSPDAYAGLFERHIDLCARSEAESEVRLYPVVGPYPVDILRFAERMGLEEAESGMLRGVELAAGLVAEGRAVAIGEVGRPHFDVAPPLRESSDRVLIAAMRAAREAGCAVVVHCERATERTWEDLARFADAAGLPRARVVKHFAPPVVDVAENRGVFPSVLASGPNVKAAARSGARLGHRYLLETDHIDDPARPGSVLGPKTVPRAVRRLLESGLWTPEDAWRVNCDNVLEAFGVRTDLGRGDDAA